MSIVTGGANGIGRALAEQVVRRGGHVVIADLDGTAATATAAALTSASAADGGSAEAVQVDVAEPGAVADLVERVSREHGRLDFMANNAGILVAGPLTEFTERQWEVAIDVNFRAVVAGGARHTP
ncbi:SDR family NAD(P)-dependent oxidoreductase [Nostocoides jenkinsii]|uniref:Short-chain dehydrogenase/reductase SDR n=1 Tax=Nostocoides jenkinsii Ben 74 TaxID=1193518 RepID=A0A077MCI0_9MICO